MLELLKKYSILKISTKKKKWQLCFYQKPFSSCKRNVKDTIMSLHNIFFPENLHLGLVGDHNVL